MNNPSVVSSSEPISILHVDDDADFLEVSKQILKISNDFKVECAISADEAYKKMIATQYDVILCDYEMPLKDGLQFLKELRAEKNDVAFMLFTGKGREEVAMTALNLGADGYYSKHGSTETVFGELVYGIKRVTDERKVKHALEEREKHYRALMDQAVDCILLLEYPTEGVPIIRDANAAALKMHGYSAEELIGKSIMFIDNHLGEKKINEIAVEMKQEKSLTFETLHQRKDGSLFNVEVYIRGLNFGSDIWAIAIERDVTERKRVQEALRSSEARYKALFDQAGDCIFLMEIPFGQLPIIRDANASALRMLDYSREELIGKPISFIDMSADIPKTESLIRHLREKSKYTFETIQRRKDGSFIDVESTVKAVKIGSDIWFLSIQRDITDRKRAEEAMKRSNARFEALYDNNYDAVLSMKPDGQFISANPTACRLFGYTEQELIQIGRGGIVVMDDRVQRAISERETTGQAKVELTFKRKDGSTFEGELTSTIFIEPTGDKSVSVIIRDVSERKKAEEELKESSQKIMTMNEKLRVVGSLTRHDVKNKLSIINANVYLLRKKMGTEPELSKYLEAISTAVTSSDKLFEFSRLYEKIGAEELTQINVADYFNEAVALMPNLTGVEVINQCQGLTVMADTLLRQLFYNLIDNSLKHGVNVTRIRTYFAQQQNDVRLFYEDNGVGISEENKQKLFTESFTTGKGSGLGLRLAKKMVDVYGWSIKETGVPGEGVKFEITIPRSLNQEKSLADFL
jgi:PAS domain S-box-containing protein